MERKVGLTLAADWRLPLSTGAKIAGDGTKDKGDGARRLGIALPNNMGQTSPVDSAKETRRDVAEQGALT